MKQLKLLTILMLLAMSLVCFAACGEEAEQPTGGEVAGGEEAGGSEEKVENVLNIIYCNTDTEARATIQAGYWLEEYVESETNGAITVDVYANNVLGDDAEVLKGMPLGTTANVFSGMGVVAEIVGTGGALVDMPFVHSSYEDWYNGIYNLGGLDLYNQVLEGSGYVCYDLQYAGAKHLSSAFQNYTTLDELQGFKIRCTNNEMNLTLWSDLGLNPTPVAWGELYTALQQGYVDSQENPVLTAYSRAYYEVNKYVTLTHHVFTYFILASNNDWWNSLDPAAREIIDECAATIRDRMNGGEMDAITQEILDAMEDAGTTIVDLTPEERAAWVEVGRSTHAKMLDKIDKTTLELTYDSLGIPYSW